MVFLSQVFASSPPCSLTALPPPTVSRVGEREWHTQVIRSLNLILLIVQSDDMAREGSRCSCSVYSYCAQEQTNLVNSKAGPFQLQCRNRAWPWAREKRRPEAVRPQVHFPLLPSLSMGVGHLTLSPYLSLLLWRLNWRVYVQSNKR